MPKLVDHEKRRRQIADALLDIAGERGLQAASMREVAARAGVSLRLVQYYFHTKDELLAGALPYLGLRFAELVEERVARLGDDPAPRDHLEAALSVPMALDAPSRRVIRTYNAYYQVILNTPGSLMHSAAVQPDAFEVSLAGIVRRAQARAQVVRAEDAELAAAGLLALGNGLGASVLGGQRTPSTAERVLRHHLDRLFGNTGETAG